jgi:hypothetical protein
MILENQFLGVRGRWGEVLNLPILEFRPSGAYQVISASGFNEPVRSGSALYDLAASVFPDSRSLTVEESAELKLLNAPYRTPVVVEPRSRTSR